MATILLLGSGEFTSKTVHIDEYLLKRAKTKKVVIFPTAAGKEKDFRKWILDGIKHFKKLGAQPIGIEAIKREDFEREDNIKSLESAGIIYFSGGHPGHLLESVKDTKVFKKILELNKEDDVILAGSSAGAMILGNFVLSNAQEVFSKNETPLWTKAIGLIKYPIIPHYDYAFQKDNKKILKHVIKTAFEKAKTDLLGIDENTGVIIFNQKRAEVWGKGKIHIFKDNKETVYEDHDKLLI